jgi:hypothetical protein
LAPSDLQSYERALLEALALPDPSLDLPPDKRIMASILNAEHPVSGHLREGLVDTLAIMGARSGQREFLTGHNGQQRADRIAYQLLDRANADTSGRLWASLSGVLPLLAEAAPDIFLSAVDTALSSEASGLLSMFADADESATLFARSPHTGLLWALENLAWSPIHLGPVSEQLARLDRLDPGGKLSNRPIASLRAIFLLWLPRTAASLDERIGFLDALRASEPEAAWRLMLAILPRSHDVTSPTHTPRWRDWVSTWEQGVPTDDLLRGIQLVLDRMLGDAGRDAIRWRDLIARLGEVPVEPVLDRLEALSPNDLSDAERRVIRDALRAEIARHRQFPDAAWALSDQVVVRLEAAYERFAPVDIITQWAMDFRAESTPASVEAG